MNGERQGEEDQEETPYDHIKRQLELYSCRQAVAKGKALFKDWITYEWENRAWSAKLYLTPREILSQTTLYLRWRLFFVRKRRWDAHVGLYTWDTLTV